MMQHGLVDMIVDRKEMRPTLAKVLRYMKKGKPA
jgi:acetyl-CoA carboxylase beta subunit